MMDAGPIYKQTAQFGNNGSMVNQLIVWRSNRADANGGMYIGAGLAMTYENNHVANTPRTALSGSISTISSVLNWICVGIHGRRVLPSPVCA